MTTRDEELEALQRALRTPHIEKPEELDVKEGALCFLDKTRFCNADCTSYLGEEPTPAERCVILQSGLHLIQLLRPQVSQVPPPTLDFAAIQNLTKGKL